MVVESSHQHSLEITKGKTQYPVRPLPGARLTIGAGTCCDLQLSGSEMPIVHSVILRESGEARIEAIAPQPKLLVNGIPVRTSDLGEGDLISIGSIELKFRASCSTTATSISSKRLSGSPNETSAPFTPDKKRDHSMMNENTLKDLSASELVDRIEQDFQMIEQYESRREQGASALLSQIRHEREDQEAHAAPEVLSETEQKSLLSDLEAMMQELTRFSEELQQRADQLTVREQHYEVAAASLLETQEKLASQLDRTLDHVGSLKDEEGEGPKRAIA